MTPGLLVSLLAALLGLILLAGGIGALRRLGAHIRMARHLAGAPQMNVGELLDAQDLPEHAVRVVGRVRCADPLVTENDDRLVAFHRDVEVRLPGGAWRSIERRRETRSFELWDHDGALVIDPARAAEPLATIPHVWSGDPAELDETYQPAMARLTASHGPPTEARATTRTLTVVDRLLVLARPVRDGAGRTSLAPPPGGFVISALELDEAMRLLGGDRRAWLVPAVVSIGIGAALAIIGLLVTLLMVRGSRP
jgi:hypothetical protein